MAEARFDRLRRSAARLRGAGEWVVLGIGMVGLPALLVAIAPNTTLAGVGVAFLAGAIAGSIVWSWITGSPMFWRRKRPNVRWWVQVGQVIVGLAFGSLAVRYMDQILPVRTGFDDHPQAMVVWIAALWLLGGTLQVVWTVVTRIVRALWRRPNTRAA